MAAYALYVAEATKARVLLETMAESARHTDRLVLPPAYTDRGSQPAGATAAIQDQWAPAYQRGEATLNALLEKRQQLTQDLNALVARLRQGHPRYAALHYPQPVPPEALPLKDQEVLLEYAIGEEATYLFRVNRGRVEKVWRVPVRQLNSNGKWRRFSSRYRSPEGLGWQHSQRSRGTVSTASSWPRRYRILLQAQRLLLCRMGSWACSPLRAWCAPGRDVKDTRFVGDMWQFSYAQSAAVLLAFLRALCHRRHLERFSP